MNEKEGKKYLIPIEDIPKFLTMFGIPINDLGDFLLKKWRIRQKRHWIITKIP